MSMNEILRCLKVYYKGAESAEKVILNCALTAAAASAVGCFVPVLSLPSMIISCFGAVWMMYAQLCDCLGIPFKTNILKVLASAALSNIATNLIGVFVVELLVAFIPGVGSVAGAAVTFACVYLAGMMFMKMLLAFAKNGKTGSDLDSMTSREAQSYMKKCEVSKEDVKDAKAAFDQSYQK